MPSANPKTSPTLTDLLFDRADVGLCLVGPDGTVVRANARWLRAMGLTAGQVVGENLVELFPSTREVALAAHAHARAGNHVEVPRHLQLVDGRETWWEGSIDPVAMEGGTGLLVVTRESAARAESSEAHREERERLSALIASIRDEVWFVDTSAQVTLANPSVMREFLLPDGTLDARKLASSLEVFRPDGSPRPIEESPLLRALQGETIDVLDEIVRTPASGELRRRQVSAAPVKDASGSIVGSVSVVRDVTELKRAEQALRDSERKYRELFESLIDGYCVLEMIFDENGKPVDFRYVETNEAFVRHATQPMLGKRVKEIIPSIEQHWLDEYGRVAVTGEPSRSEGVVAGLGGQWFRTSAFRVGGEGSRRVAVLFENVTEHKRAENALRESEGRFAAMADGTPVLIWSTDTKGRVEFVNRAYCDFFGTTQEAITRDGWQPLVHPEDAPGYVGTFTEALANRSAFHAEARVRRADGEWRWVESFGQPRFTPTGEFLGITGSSPDITERKRAEDALREADRRKDEFLAMVSHELRNPLAGLRNATYILARAEALDERGRRAVRTLERQTDHLTRVVDDLLDLTRIVHGKLSLHRQRVDLRDVAAHAAADFRVQLLERGVTLDLAFAGGPVVVNADPTRVTQVLTNLLQNAAKFTRTGDTVTVTVRSHGDAAEVEVEDTGAGIDPSLLPTIFEPFVQGERTLGRSDRGLGLGLALVKGIAQLHGGSAHVESPGPGKGSTFSVRFPLAASIAAPASSRLPVAVGVTPRSILVVDDDHDGADTLVELLRLLGHAVDVAYDGVTAIQKIRAAPPNVVLCDITMPEMSGHELASTLRAMAPDAMRIIAVTGHAHPDDVRRAIAAGFDALLAKPVDIAEIERLLR